MFALRAALPFALGACGRIAFAPVGDAVGGDGGATIDGAPAVRCGIASQLSDDFEGTFDAERWGATYTDAGVSTSQSAGVGRITLAANTPGISYGAIETGRSYDLTGDAVVAEIATTPDPAAPSAEMLFAVLVSSMARVDLVVSHGTIRMRRSDPSIVTVAGPVPFALATHRYLRLREAGGMIIGEASGNGIDWAVLGATPTPFDVQYTQISLGGGTYASEASPGVAEWASVNLGVSVPNRFCPIDGAHDDFSANVLSPRWARRFGFAACDETGGAIQMPLPAAQMTGCQIVSRPLFELTGRAVAIAVPQVTPNLSGSSTSFGVATAPQTNATLIAASGKLAFQIYDGGSRVYVTPAPPAYDPIAHRFWRVRHDVAGAALVAETSPDASTWAELDRTTTIPFATAAVYLQMEVETATSAAPGGATFDDLNGP